MKRKQDTEKRIFLAALKVFQEYGYEGTRMQKIADVAGINKSMLHYYYRSKSKLFDAVFSASAKKHLPGIIDNLKSDLPLQEKIERVVSDYIDIIGGNPHLPAFFLHELRRNPDLVRQFADEQAKGVFSIFSKQVRKANTMGEIRHIEPEHLFANILAMCVFPFIAQPMLQTVFNADDETYVAFLVARKTEITRFIFNAIAP